MKKTALITGASSGIGFELAKIFAQNNYNLVLIARNMDALQKAAQTLQKDENSIVLLSEDLSHTDAPDEIYQELQRKGIIIDILVNNAGFATYGYFAETNLQDELAELQVNIVALTHITKLLMRDMVKRGDGKILNIASTAAFVPGPLMAVYYATKAYVLSFSEALANEVKGTGVSVSVLCPGPTNTGFVKRAHLEKTKLFQGKTMDAKTVAKVAYQGLMDNKTIIIPGLKNKLLVKTIPLVPRSIITRFVRKLQESVA